jgi:hypothetical protein
MSALGAILLGLSLLTSRAEPTLAGGLTVHVTHEWGHDLAALAAGRHPVHPLALWGDKWAELYPDARGGMIGQTWIVATTLDPDVGRWNRVYGTAYAWRAWRRPSEAGDLDPVRHRGAVVAAWLVTGVILEAIAEDRR